ncbi:hypothetical protein ACFL7M_02255 [Thermodesulfobacteriota bacterium]
MSDEKEIMEMRAGRLLNTRVAEEIMGNKVIKDEIFGEMEIYFTKDGEPVYSALHPYSEDLSAAQTVIDRIVELGCQDEAAFLYGEDRPEVICRASLRAVLKRKKKEELREQKSKLKIIR